MDEGPEDGVLDLSVKVKKEAEDEVSLFCLDFCFLLCSLNQSYIVSGILLQ